MTIGFCLLYFLFFSASTYMSMLSNGKNMKMNGTLSRIIYTRAEKSSATAQHYIVEMANKRSICVNIESSQPTQQKAKRFTVQILYYTHYLRLQITQRWTYMKAPFHVLIRLHVRTHEKFPEQWGCTVNVLSSSIRHLSVSTVKDNSQATYCSFAHRISIKATLRTIRSKNNNSSRAAK